MAYDNGDFPRREGFPFFAFNIPQMEEFTPPSRDFDGDFEGVDETLAEYPHDEGDDGDEITPQSLGFHFDDDDRIIEAYDPQDGEDEETPQVGETIRISDEGRLRPTHHKEGLLAKIAESIPDPGDDDEPTTQLREALEAFQEIDPHEGGRLAGYASLALDIGLGEMIPEWGGGTAPSIEGGNTKSDQ